MNAAGPSELPIKPVLILSTGRCGSTMVSEMLNRHPGVLSLSEFFSTLGAAGFAWSRPDGARMWKTYSRQSAAVNAMLRDGQIVSEILYGHEAARSRFQAANMPPIMAVTLPHLTDQPEALYDALEPVVSAQPRRPLGDQYRFLFQHLAQQFGRRVWVERSGGSLMQAAKLLHLFPEARVIHVYRDGRDTSQSMSQHHNFRVLIAALKKLRALGIDARRQFLKPKGGFLELALQSVVFRRMDVPSLLRQYPLELADFGAFWSDLILLGERVLKPLPAARRLDVKFEDVQHHPREKLTELIRFIDPSLENEPWLEEAAAMLRPTRSRFTQLPASEQAAVTEACAPGLRALGYLP
jgi:hypothetical protein